MQVADMNEAQANSQAALDSVTIQDPEKDRPKEESKPKVQDHIFDQQAALAEKQEQEKAEQARKNAQAAIEYVTVKQVESRPEETKKEENAPLMPKSFTKDKKHSVSESEVEKQIRLAENH